MDSSASIRWDTSHISGPNFPSGVMLSLLIGPDPAFPAAQRNTNHLCRLPPDRFEPIHRRKPNGEVDPHPWCRGYYAAMRLRMSDWAPLLDTSDVNHALLLPILLHCRDEQVKF